MCRDFARFAAVAVWGLRHMASMISRIRLGDVRFVFSVMSSVRLCHGIRFLSASVWVQADVSRELAAAPGAHPVQHVSVHWCSVWRSQEPPDRFSGRVCPRRINHTAPGVIRKMRRIFSFVLTIVPLFRYGGVGVTPSAITLREEGRCGKRCESAYRASCRSARAVWT